MERGDCRPRLQAASGSDTPTWNTRSEETQSRGYPVGETPVGRKTAVLDTPIRLYSTAQTFDAPRRTFDRACRSGVVSAMCGVYACVAVMDSGKAVSWGNFSTAAESEQELMQILLLQGLTGP